MLSDLLAAQAQPALDAWLGAIEQMVAQSMSPAEIQQRLLAMYGDLPVEQLVEIMAQGFALAALVGMDDVTDGR